MRRGLIQFGDFVLDQGAYELTREGHAVPLPRIPELLFILVEKRDELVLRQQILDRIWGKGVFVDADNAINTAVRKLRRALDDDPNQPRFIATVSGKGYRFIGAAATVPFTAVRARPSEPAPTMGGRDEELARLDSWYARVLDGDRQIVFVTGEPGIGKTHSCGPYRLYSSRGRGGDDPRAVHRAVRRR